ncbi:hypothetical protein GmHk_19G054832 [Glycine max]|nr:hypothetical protein GmHk_19G054832 [Glycine max]
MRSFNGDFPPWRCSGRQRRRGERRRHPLRNKPWKKELCHQESALDKRLGEGASMEEKKERERERERGEHEIEGRKEEEKLNFEVCLIRLSFIKVTTSVTNASIYRLVKKRGANSNHAHLGLPDSSSRRRLLLEEATWLAWASRARLGELGGKLLPYFPINRRRSEEGKGSAFLAFRNHLKLPRRFRNVSVTFPWVIPRRFSTILRSFFIVLRSSTDVTNLKELGRLMGPLQRQAFRKVYGKILDLTAAEVFTEAVVSLAQYYDQPLRCFTFGDFQMVPTIEEFEEILGCPLGGRKPYLFSGFLPSLSKIAAVVGDSAKELDRTKQTRNGVVGLPRKYLEGKARDMASQEKWGPFADILALLIFGVVLFPNVDGLVDLAAIDAFLAYHHSKESPVVAILADLFDTFDQRCEKNSARIVCCLPALCVWLEGKEGVLFSCGDYPNVPLIGTRGCINYNPALAIRQLGYPMRGAPTEESLSPFLVRDLGVQGLKVIQRIHKAWRKVMLKLQKTIEDKATATASSTVREAEPVLQPALNPGRDRNTTVFGRRYSLQAYPYGLPPDFTSRATPEDLSQAPTFEGQLPPYDDYPGQDDEEGDTHLGPLLHLKDLSPHELPQLNIIRHIPASPTPVKESVPFAEDKGKIEALEERWRDLAAQVVPPMTEREMITIMVDTLPTFYYEKLIGYMPANFADLVFAGERIESGLRKGKFEYAANMAPNNNRRAPVVGARKREGDTHAVTTAPTSYQPNPPNFLIRAGNSIPTQVKGPPAAERASAQHTAPAAPRPVNNTAPGATYQYAQHPPPKDNFPPIPIAYSELWPSLLENHLVVAIPGKVLQPPYPKWYDPSAKCAYHSGVLGNNIDSCLPFKYKVRHLISAGWLSFQEEGPNVQTNPLASHGGASVNAVKEDGPLQAKRLGEVATSRRFIYQSLQAVCMVSRGGGEWDECLFHLGESHDMETCPAVEELLQQLMDWGQLEVSIGGREEPQICMQSEEKKVPLTPKALVICFTRKGTGPTPVYPRAAPKPTPFAYQSNKAVPWKYTPPTSSERVATKVDSLSAKVTNITGLSGVTRSGRVFASPHPAELPSKGKAPMVQEPTDIATPSKEVDPPVARGAEKKEGLQGKTVTLEEAHEFLRLIQQSEFKVVEQLNKTPARISLLELLIKSEPHRALLMKVLNDAHVAHDISVEGFEGIVNHITTNNYIAFAEEEIPVEGRGHNKALHVSVRCMDHVVAKVLIDNGSSLNVMLKATLEKLPFSASRLKPSSMVVRAFDGTRREVMGEIDIPIQIGPHTCNVVFQVMDINPAYSWEWSLQRFTRN